MLNPIRKLRNLLFPRKWNQIIDEKCHALSDSAMNSYALEKGLSFGMQNISEAEYWEWINKTELPFKKETFPHKKALEFFISYCILEPSNNDSLLDAAGGHSGYLESVKVHVLDVELYLTDHIYKGVAVSENGITIVGGDISNIHLPDESITKIACHHAFEHFQGEKDSGFIREIARILHKGGRACIIPIFITEFYAECMNIDKDKPFDPEASLIIDLTASIPGAADEGHFARFYNLQALERRVIEVALASGLSPQVVTVKMDGKDIPDMSRNFGSKINSPMRALILDKNTNANR